jgi:transposase
MRDGARPYRVFLSGNCQMQFVHDALKLLYRGAPEIALTFRAAYLPARPGDAAAARSCDVHVMQVANLAADPWTDLVPARRPRIRVPALALPGLFHVLAPRIHPDHAQRGRPPYYLARGNQVLNGFAARFRRGEPAEALLADYLAYRGGEIGTAPRLFEMNCIAMRRIGRQADFDPWRDIEPRLAERRFFWSVKHPTLAAAMMLVRGVLDALGLPWDQAALDALARGPEYHEPYHAPIHPRLAERLALAWAGDETRYRFFHSYFTAAEHARRYIAGDFQREFALNQAIHGARTRADGDATLALFRANRALFPAHGQAELWYGRVLQRAGKPALASFHYRRALDGARQAPHLVPHRADVPADRIEAWLKRCRKPKRRAEPANLAAGLARLEAEELRLLAQIRALEARRRLTVLRAAARQAR